MLTFFVQGFYCQMLVGGMPTSISLPLDQCIVPQGVEGPVGLFITSDNQPLNNNVRDRATQAVLAGPTMAFIDTQKQLLSQLVLAGSASGSTDSSTTTISPSDHRSRNSLAVDASYHAVLSSISWTTQRRHQPLETARIPWISSLRLHQ